MNVVDEFVNMILAQRSYESNSRVVKAAEKCCSSSTSWRNRCEGPMMRYKSILCSIVCCRVLRLPASAAPAHYPISAEQIAAAVSTVRRVRLRRTRLRLLTDVVASAPTPALAGSFSRQVGNDVMVRMECDEKRRMPSLFCEHPCATE